jgi:type I restriction enzyme S subunit
MISLEIFLNHLKRNPTIIGGGTPSKKNDEFYIGNIPWATVRDMKIDKIKDTEFKITSKAVLNSSTNIILLLIDGF